MAKPLLHDVHMGGTRMGHLNDAVEHLNSEGRDGKNTKMLNENLAKELPKDQPLIKRPNFKISP